MWVLALDTTSRDGSVALIRDDAVVLARPGDAGVSHAERIPADLRAILADAGLGLHAVDVFAVATGPGGFTGLRIGLAAVQGLALALDRPTAGVPSLDALAWDVLDRMPEAAAAGAWMDASRGEVFAAAFTRPDATTPPGWPLTPSAPATAASPAATLTAWRALVPAGTAIAATCLPAAAAEAGAAGYVTTTPAVHLAAVVGRLAWRLHQLGHTGPPARLAPEYVRRPDVEIERDRRRTAERTG
ncbi:MAG: tRNA (adenosine(37)-N6)-threonylcarbamoyltransferase complex dimerization subunit type 1 TsaB [Acidobacteria bacterium]|nr:tRNA (adenosine(37)-N6)-threonylcarbamoyltransferase complex dimerization subunit type 1 TsaB [Acidobacteriota bacterium]